MFSNCIWMAAVLALLGLSAARGREDKPKQMTTSQFVNATTDPSGNQLPGRVAVRANRTITCTKAEQSNPSDGYKAACYVVTSGSGGSSVLEKDQTMRTGSGGKLTLTCIGTGNLACQVRIDR
jgi:hypothetical protein